MMSFSEPEKYVSCNSQLFGRGSERIEKNIVKTLAFRIRWAFHGVKLNI